MPDEVRQWPHHVVLLNHAPRCAGTQSRRVGLQDLDTLEKELADTERCDADTRPLPSLSEPQKRSLARDLDQLLPVGEGGNMDPAHLEEDVIGVTNADCPVLPAMQQRNALTVLLDDVTLAPPIDRKQQIMPGDAAADEDSWSACARPDMRESIRLD
ncbi:MAG: hypothetical protein AAFW01_13500 [Pseudomonadota bacterium]